MVCQAVRPCRLDLSCHFAATGTATIQERHLSMMLRRDFLKQTGTAALAAAASGPFVHASDKAGGKNPVDRQG